MSNLNQPLRLIEPDDVESIFQIDQQEYGSHWSKEQLKCWIENQKNNYVLEQGEKIIGFFIVKIVADEAELLHLGISKDKQGKGFGRYLFQNLLAMLKQKQVQRLFLEVRASNQKAIRLYQSFGAKRVGARKNYYTYCFPHEDAWILEFSI